MWERARHEAATSAPQASKTTRHGSRSQLADTFQMCATATMVTLDPSGGARTHTRRPCAMHDTGVLHKQISIGAKRFHHSPPSHPFRI